MDMPPLSSHGFAPMLHGRCEVWMNEPRLLRQEVQFNMSLCVVMQAW